MGDGGNARRESVLCPARFAWWDAAETVFGCYQFVNFLLYGFFSVFLFALARWVPIPQCFGPRKGATGPLFSPEITVALLFCGAAKGMALGGP